MLLFGAAFAPINRKHRIGLMPFSPASRMKTVASAISGQVQATMPPPRMLSGQSKSAHPDLAGDGVLPGASPPVDGSARITSAQTRIWRERWLIATGAGGKQCRNDQRQDQMRMLVERLGLIARRDNSRLGEDAMIANRSRKVGRSAEEQPPLEDRRDPDSGVARASNPRLKGTKLSGRGLAPKP